MLYTHGEGSFSTRVLRESHLDSQSVSRTEHLDISYITLRLDAALDHLSGGHQIVLKPRKNERKTLLPHQTPFPLFTPDEVQPVSYPTDRMVPVWSHESIINFNNRGGFIPDVLAQEQSLLSSLDRLRGSTQDFLLITNGTLCSRGTSAGSQVGLYPTPLILNKKGVVDWKQTHHILSLPPFNGAGKDDETDSNEYGFPASVHNLLQAASNCRDCGRVHISSDVYIRALDASEFDPNEGQLPFRLQVLNQISLLTPNIFESIEELREIFPNLRDVS
ncbi:hypothetical protein BS47DRAFT_1387105 [Hydnum rufescens UP504]|uniref:Uncharacterized protein n=1 Tax=Hydnum rufescens UP504 TaxID=1448309 RepID=A0A9P6E260_9AGAM|nr:hypothetical protein BS47DRAFT_1387105 [Hydnum rufescens UP504]